MLGRGCGLTRDQQIAHVVGQLEALGWDIRQARANNDLAELAELEVKRDHLLDWMLRLQPAETSE